MDFFKFFLFLLLLFINFPFHLQSEEKEINYIKLITEGRNLKEEEVKALENQLEKEPSNLEIRSKLLAYYFSKSLKDKSVREKYQKNIIFLIKNFPKEEIFQHSEAHLNHILDKEAYIEAKNLWLENLKKYPEDIKIITNAAAFFTLSDKDISKELYIKAKKIEPENMEWPYKLGHLYSLEMIGKGKDEKKILAKKTIEEFEIALKLSKNEEDKFYILTNILKFIFETEDYAKAKGYAISTLEMAEKFKDNWNYGNAYFYGNILLGRISLREGNLEKAKEYLILAGNTPASPQLSSFGPSMILAKELLEKGEKDVVIEYLKLCSKFWKLGKEKLDKWLKEIEKGLIPDFEKQLR